jgi:hypothetical protein
MVAMEMENMQEGQAVREQQRTSGVAVKIARYVRIGILVAEYMYDELIDAIIDSARVVQSEGRLFLGSVCTVIGLMNFRNGKYCDGNSVDYLSCTRPVAYYYYSGFEIVLVVLGVTLMLVWFLKRTPKMSETR